MSLPDRQTRRRRLGSTIETLRERAGLSAAEIARAMGEDAAFGARIALWEAGREAPSVDELWRFLEAAGATFADLDPGLRPEASNPRLKEIAAELEALNRR